MRGLTSAAVLRELIESGKISPPSTEPAPLAEALAIRYMLERRARGKVVMTVWAIRRVAVAPILGAGSSMGLKYGKAGVKFLWAHRALVRGRPPGHGAGQAGGLMLGEHLIHLVLSATDLGTARDSYHDWPGPGDPYRGPSTIVFRYGGGARLALTWMSLDGLDPCAAPP